MTARLQAGAVAAVAAAAVVAAVGAVRWRYCVVTLRGSSMEPGLSDGDRLLARRCGLRGLRRGWLVVFREPGLARSRPAWRTGAAQDVWVIKRVAGLPGDLVPDAVRLAAGGTPTVPPGAIVVLGDSAVSRDSRQWGFVPASHVYGAGERRLSRGRLPSPAGDGE